jgi:hypothetical protein
VVYEGDPDTHRLCGLRRSPGYSETLWFKTETGYPETLWFATETGYSEALWFTTETGYSETFWLTKETRILRDPVVYEEVPDTLRLCGLRRRPGY